jgi:hypothetical protein
MCTVIRESESVWAYPMMFLWFGVIVFWADAAVSRQRFLTDARSFSLAGRRNDNML